MNNKRLRIVGSVIAFIGVALLFANSTFFGVFLLIIGVSVFAASFARRVEKTPPLEQQTTHVSSKKLSMKNVAISLIVLFLIIVGISVAREDSGSTPTAKESDSSASTQSEQLGIGEEGILNNNSDPENCAGTVLVASTKENLDKAIDTMIADDNYGLLEMIELGQAALIPNCTAVKVIDRTFATRRVRFLDDPSVTGWVPYEYAVKK